MKMEIKFFDGAMPVSSGNRTVSPIQAEYGKAGAWAEFTGTVRQMEKGEKIPALRYDIYQAMAKKVLTSHIEELAQKYGLLAVRFWHREGLVPVGESSVFIAIAAPHRKEAFAAIAELLDRLKADVPIWKIEADADLPKVEVAEKTPPAPGSMGAVWKVLGERVSMLEDERVPLAQAYHRILQEEVKADVDQPPFDRSAVDGYAIVPGEFPAKFHVIGVVKAGETAARAPGPGEALRIFTGAQVPARGLAIVMQELVKVDGEFIHVEKTQKIGDNVRGRASDAHAGDVLLSAGQKLTALELAILASVGAVNPLVKALPHVAHATTGDEIVSPDATPKPGQIRNSNQILISGLLQSCRVPATNVHQEHWGDDPVHAAARLASEPFAKADVILISGGASVGEHDYTARLLEGAGFELVVRSVNMRPGRPLLIGFRGRQVAFGLPGNPVSHYACFLLFVAQVLERQMTSRPKPWPWPRFCSRKLSQKLICTPNPRPTLCPARQSPQHGAESLIPLRWSNSGSLSALAGANCLIFVPPNTAEIPAGENVRVTFTHPLFIL